MSCIYERTKKNGNPSFQVIIREKHLSPIFKTFQNREDAEEFAFHIHTKLKSSPPKPTKKPAVEREARLMNEKLVDIISRFVKSSDVRQRHLNITPTIVANVGDIKIGEIRKSWVKNFVKHMRAKKSKQGRPYADSTIAALVWTMNIAVKWRADELDLPHPNLSLSVERIDGKWDVKRERRFEAGEEEAILARMDNISTHNREHWKLLMLFALQTGARLQELVLAEWREFDLDRRVWMIPKEHTKAKKTRAVPLNDAGLAIAKRLHELSKPELPRVFHAIGAKPQCVTACFHRYVAQAGVVNFRFHDLRHEAISRMALYWRKFSMHEIMAIVGHTRMEMFQRYANLRADELAQRFVKNPVQATTSFLATNSGSIIRLHQ